MFVDRSVFWIWSVLIGILGIVAAIPVLNHPLFAAVLLPATFVLYLGLLGAAVASFPVAPAAVCGPYPAVLAASLLLRILLV
jgi:hypothetical protein